MIYVPLASSPNAAHIRSAVGWSLEQLLCVHTIQRLEESLDQYPPSRASSC